MNDAIAAPAPMPLDLRRASLWIVGLFWSIQFVELTIVSLTEGRATALASLGPRAFVLVAGMVLMRGFIEVVVRLQRRPFRARLVLGVAAALIVCLMLSTINFVAFDVVFTRAEVGFNVSEYVYTAFAWSWFCLSVAGALLALSYTIEVREHERLLAAMEAKANRAQLAALRYQLNPHFLFNTLNSIAALVGQDERIGAECMIENLADFLRATLELDPLADIPLSREIELQHMYLSIEQQRFPDRLLTRFDLAAEVMSAAVPPLITQPLVENAIRHAVARSRVPVTLTVTARADGDALILSIADDGAPEGHAVRKGTGLGIANVGARLEQRFGMRQSLQAIRPAAGGFLVRLTLPLRLPGVEPAI
jgi:two-component system, LytTR family, sensor kinase